MKQYSIAEAKNQLSKVVHEAEGDGHVELTRRGKPVAVVLSFAEYQRLREGHTRPLWKAIEEFRAAHAGDLEELTGALEDLRQRDPGREFSC